MRLRAGPARVSPSPAPRAYRVLSRRGALRLDVHGVQRLAGRHEEAVALGPAEAHVAADLGQADASDDLALRRPHRDPAVADAAPRVAGAPQVAVDVAAHAVGPALHPVDHEAGEELPAGELVVTAHVEHVHVALAARTGIAWPLARADDVELLVVG